MTKVLISSLFCLLTTASLANPYWDETKVPKLAVPDVSATWKHVSQKQILDEGIEVLRVEIAWGANETYRVAKITREFSGTTALLRRSKVPDSLGSYKGTLIDRNLGTAVAYDSIGTGREYRKLARSLTFRFPYTPGEYEFRLTAEHPKTGVMEDVLKAKIEIPNSTLQSLPNIDIRTFDSDPLDDSLKVAIYGEGYSTNQKEAFFQDAAKIVQSLRSSKWPGVAKMDFKAVFAPSRVKLGAPRQLGLPVPVRDSFLGLYYPYWDNFGRWDDVVYPSSEDKYRTALAQVPYDYPITIVDSSEYWGVGNFNAIAAIPNRNNSFVYLLFHEFGHYFGLNEEYEGGGRTELEFADGIPEPWSQNMSFERNLPHMHWSELILNSTPIPTPNSVWNASRRGPVGAYRGGYADSGAKNKNHKPVRACIMDRASKFCPVCTAAILDKMNFDLGE